jgi:putative DNA primase/helicase
MMFGPFLREAGLGEVYAKRGRGKTWFVASMAYAIATGGEYLGWNASRPHGVLIVDGENDPNEFKNRLLDIHRLSGEGEFPSQLHFMMKQDMELGWDRDLSSEEGRALVEAELEGVELLILDNLSCLFGKLEENDALSWEPVNTWLLSLKRRGIAVIFVHHSGKNGGQRGSSKKEDSLDFVICLQEPEHRKQSGAAFKVAFEKNRVGPEPAPFEAELISEGKEEQEQPVRWEKRPVGKLGAAPLSKLQQEIARRLNEGQSTAQIVEDLNTTKGTVSKVRKKIPSEETSQIAPTPSEMVSKVSTPKGVWKPGNHPSPVSPGNFRNLGNLGNSLSTKELFQETNRKPEVSCSIVGL